MVGSALRKRIKIKSKIMSKSVLREYVMVLKPSHIVAVVVMGCGLSHIAIADEIDYARDIRPILSENCLLR